MDQQISDRTVTPRDCIFGVSVPTDPDEYHRQSVLPDRHEFASSVSRQVRHYDSVVGRPLRSFARRFAELGVDVRMNFAASDLAGCLADPSTLILIVMAHWSKDRVEFADGFIDVDGFVGLVPASYSGILDLCICHPKNLVGRLQNRRPNLGLIKYVDTLLSVDQWLWFYYAVFSYLSGDGMTYLQAVDLTLRAFEIRASRGRRIRGALPHEDR